MEPDQPDPRELARRLFAETGDADVGEIKRSLLPLADAGDVEAMELLGAIELEIEGKLKAALFWFERAAELGGVAAQRSLGHMYADGIGVRQDGAKAAALLRKAALAGDPFAMYNLAAINVRDDGAYTNFEGTLMLLEGAAEAGLPQAVALLGDMLARVDRDAEAIERYKQAAGLGHTPAMYALGCWARDGIVGPSDLVEAVHWYLQMVVAGDPDGMGHAMKLAGSMSAEDVAEAARRAGRPDLGKSLLG